MTAPPSHPRRADRAGHGPTEHPHAGFAVRGVPPGEAKRLASKLEIHHTPKHGIWLNTAGEAELSVLTRHCLDRRISDQHPLMKETHAWGHDRSVSQSSHATAAAEVTHRKALQPAIAVRRAPTCIVPQQHSPSTWGRHPQMCVLLRSSFQATRQSPTATESPRLCHGLPLARSQRECRRLRD